jgi:uncharacterized protein involved in exopolysaccharide biosynthesis
VLVWAPLWIFTTALFGGLGVAYVVFVKQDTFLASQALLVRDEATGAVMRLGRFQSQAEMKAAQETILEMAKSQQVVRDALLAVGRPEGLAAWLNWGEFPSKELIEEVAKSSILVHAPKGVEFGVTEVIYLDSKANTPSDAMELNKALCDALESRLQQVRKARADGVITELTHARDSAKRELSASTERLKEQEQNAGSDLSDLRGLTDTVAGAATSRAEFDQIKNEIRQAEINRQTLLADRELLVRATEDPSSFIVAPGAVLNSQPGLKRLREGLVDAQLSGAQLTGRFTDVHPLVNSSQAAQASIVKRFSQELKASISSVESDLALVDRRIQRLENQRASAEQRLIRLADSRANYANMLSEVKSKVALMESAERELAEAQAARDSSVSTSLLTRLDAAIVSDRPIGPGRTTIAAMCGIAGLIFGLGVVFVVTPIDAGPSFGRRAVDRSRSRRGVDDRVENSGLVPPSDAVLPSPALSEYQAKSAAASKFQPSANETSAQTLAKSIAELASDLDNETQFPIQKPRESTPISEFLTASKPSSPEVDLAFQELAKLQSRKPENRSEELSIQSKIHELKGFLSGQGIRPLDPKKAADSEEPPRHKPRPTKT